MERTVRHSASGDDETRRDLENSQKETVNAIEAAEELEIKLKKVM